MTARKTRIASLLTLQLLRQLEREMVGSLTLCLQDGYPRVMQRATLPSMASREYGGIPGNPSLVQLNLYSQGLSQTMGSTTLASPSSTYTVMSNHVVHNRSFIQFNLYIDETVRPQDLHASPRSWEQVLRVFLCTNGIAYF